MQVAGDKGMLLSMRKTVGKEGESLSSLPESPPQWLSIPSRFHVHWAALSPKGSEACMTVSPEPSSGR